MNRIRQILPKLALLVGAVAFMVFIIEIALRVAGVSYPRTTQADPVLGFVRRPGVTYRFQEEGDAQVQINSEGFRDGEWPVEKPPGEFRVAVLGDSYVEALQVPVDERFTELLAGDLKSCSTFARKTVRVMNFGISGYGTGQELLALRHRVAKYRPDLVVLCFLTSNDFRDNCRSLLSHPQRPFYVPRDGKLVLDDSFLATVARERSWTSTLVYTLADYSRIVQMIYRARRNLKVRAEVALAQTQGDEVPGETGLDYEIYRQPSEAKWLEAWELTEQLLLATADETHTLGAEFLVVMVTNAEQVHPDSKVRERFMQRLGVSTLDYPELRIAHFCANTGLTCSGSPRRWPTTPKRIRCTCTASRTPNWDAGTGTHRAIV